MWFELNTMNNEHPSWRKLENMNQVTSCFTLNSRSYAKFFKLKFNPVLLWRYHSDSVFPQMIDLQLLLEYESLKRAPNCQKFALRSALRLRNDVTEFNEISFLQMTVSFFQKKGNLKTNLNRTESKNIFLVFITAKQQIITTCFLKNLK